MKRDQGIDVLVTGDISEVDGYPNWMRECSKASHVEVCTPLWHIERTILIERLFSDGFNVVFSCVKMPWFTRDWVGRSLDLTAYCELKYIAANTGADLSGENGEYHTVVLDSPSFTKKLLANSFSIIQADSLMYLSTRDISICHKE